MHKTVDRYLPAIKKLPKDRPLTKQDLLTEQFLMKKDRKTEIYYAPHNEYINSNAKIIIIGITPGWNQMKTAYEQFIQSIAEGEDIESCLIQTKKAARFFGSMRRNLTTMLDQCGIPEVLGILTSSDLFEKSSDLLHTTSVIKYPVFTHGKNYNGHHPAINSSPLLQHHAYEEFPKELAHIASPALLIPLGKTVEQIISKLVKDKKISGHTYLNGFPHPSGANGHRMKQFQQNQKQLCQQVEKWHEYHSSFPKTFI